MIDAIRAIARAAGVGRGLERARYVTRLAADTAYRREALRLRREFLVWRRRHGATLTPSLYPAGSTKRVLVVTKGTLPAAQVELALIIGSRAGRVRADVLTNRTDLLAAAAVFKLHHCPRTRCRRGDAGWRERAEQRRTGARA